MSTLTSPDTSVLAPLSTAQNRIWILEHMDNALSASNNQLQYRVHGNLDTAVLTRSINILIERHDALRTIFVNGSGTPAQKVLPELSAEIAIIDLQGQPEEIQQQRITEYAGKSGKRKFDLGIGPLFSFDLLVLGNNEYIFLLSFHHIITDAVSADIFLEELMAVYSALADGSRLKLPELNFSFAGHAAMELQWLETPGFREQLGHWKRELEGVNDLLQLPLDFTRPRVLGSQAFQVRFTIGSNLSGQLFRLAKNHDTGVSVPMATAFAVLLSRYASQNDLVIGVPFSKRENEELRSALGVLVNTLPLRFDFTGEMSFSDAVEHTRARYLSARENQDVPFEKIVDELQVKRTMNMNPLYQVLFNYLGRGRSEITLPGLTMTPLEAATNTSMADLVLEISDHGDQMNCAFHYNPGLFRRETIERLTGHFMTVLAAIAENEFLPVAKIPVLTQDEADMILTEWNDSQVDFPRNKCVHNIVEEQAAMTPDAIAVADDTTEITYSQLNERANQLARYLVKRGAKEDTVVTLFVERTVDMIIGLLAITKTGATYLPLDPIYPKARLELILDDAKPVLYLTQRSSLDKLPVTGADIVLIDEPSEYESEPVHNLNLGNPEKPAYILYTSGSTGKPKGVQIKQDSLVNLVNSFGNMMKVTPKDILLTVSTIAFDIAELEVFLPLFNGGKLVVASQETVMNMDLLARRIDSSGATLFQATPVTYKMLLMNNWKGKSDLRVITGGDALTKEQGKALIAICKEVWNCYGPTETTIYSSGKLVVPQDLEGEGVVSIGKPLDNNLLYVLSPGLMPLPAGVAGELFIGGDSVSPGYLNLPELTAEKFIQSPFSDDPSQKLYRSGDLVKYLPDGNIAFLNRIDSQVKIRGFRIELGEIETIFSRFPGIKENVIVVKDDSSGEKMLVAYYTKQAGASIPLHELRTYLREKLPDYMVPSFYMELDKFPLTANNKIDKKSLPMPDSYEQDISEVFVGPSTATEKKMSSIWESVLKKERISIHDDFFEAGGHSMLAVTLIIRIEKEFGKRLPLATLFEHSTIHQLSDLVDKDTTPVKWRSLVPIRPDGSKKPLFLIHGLGLNVLLYTTIINHLDPDQPVYGLQAKGLNGTDKPLDTIEEIAAYYIQEISTIDSEGPYAMAGFSLGGKIAFEMARQLVESGKQVNFLGLFDATADESFSHLPLTEKIWKKAVHLVNYTIWNIGSFFKGENETPLNVAKRKLNGLERKITGMDVKIKKEDAVSKGRENELPGYMREVHRANRRADKRYVIKPYNGGVHLFKAKKQTFYIADPVCYGWDKAAIAGVFIHEIPGEHSSIFAPPNDEYFADILQENLNNSSN